MDVRTPLVEAHAVGQDWMSTIGHTAVVVLVRGLFEGHWFVPSEDPS